MIMSLGGTPEPLIKSISTYGPEIVIFLASHDSVPLSHDILSSVKEKPKPEFVITENPNSLNECYTKARECIDRAEKTQFSSEKIIVDYTGGTKVMTAALLLAALGRSYQFNYVGGGLRNKNGLGRVINEHEKMFNETSPWALFAEEERRQIVTLFNCRRFSAVIDIISLFKRQAPPKITDYFGFIMPLANGFLLWDQFDHKAARRYIEKGMIALKKYIATYQSTELEPFLESVKKCSYRLDDIAAKNTGQGNFNDFLVTDLINNARRKMEDKRFDDAAARIYRALELYGQIVFKKVAGCDNSRVKLNIIPENLKSKFEKKYYDSYTKHLKLPMSATFEYLNSMGNNAGKRFFKMEKEIKKIQTNRNHSILAHGINPVSEHGAESILKTVCEFIEKTDSFDFPKLP